MTTIIIRKAERLKLQNFMVCFFSTIFCKLLTDGFLRIHGAVKEVVVHFRWPEVEACLEIKPHFEEIFDAWIVFADHAS